MTFERLDQMSDLQLLQTIAFDQHDFSPEAQVHLHQILLARGYSENTVKEWRADHLRSPMAEQQCTHCRTMLDLDEEDLVSGHFTCPVCSQRQPVRYDLITHLIIRVET